MNANPASPSVSSAAGDFLSEMSVLMGLPRASGHALKSPCTFRGPGGLLCRLQMLEDGAVTAVRPEVLLPMAARELMGPDVERLLALQQALMLELGWYLGLSSEGWLQLSPLGWIEEPQAAVSALDVGQAVGMRALSELFGEETEGEPGSGPLQHSFQ